MKALVLYYSLEGNTKLIAEAITEELNCDIMRLTPKKDIPQSGFSRYFRGGKQVVLKEKPELEDLNKNIEDYDLIIIGSPVWASSYAPAFNTFFSQNNISNKKVILFCCYAGSEGKIFDNFKERLNNNEIIGSIGFKDPLKNDKENNIQNCKKWIKSVIKTLE